MAAYQGKEKPTVKSADALLALKDDKTDRQISNMRTDEAVKYSTVNLSFSQSAGINKQIVANPDLSAYNSSMGSRLWLSAINGWELFADIVIGIANLWVFMIIGLIGWLGYRFYKKRHIKNFIPNI